MTLSCHITTTQQFGEVEHINRELDKFVNSISHDLSAPLKSIRGLVNISRTEKMSDRLEEYMDHIELSTEKLEDFISEILDFSRNDRLPVTYKYVKLLNPWILKRELRPPLSDKPYEIAIPIDTKS